MKMEKNLYFSLLLFGVFSVAGFYLLLLRFMLPKEMQCFIPELLLADPVYVFVACR